MKKEKVLKVIISIILVIVFVILVYIIRNYIIINKTSKMQEELMKKTNYSYTLEFCKEKDNANKTIIKYTYKDGRGKTECDGNIIDWLDDNSKEYISIDSVQKKATVYENRYGEYRK